MKALSSQTGSLSTGNDANGADVLNALLEEQDRLLSSHVLATLQRYRYHERWGCSDGWLDLTWRLKQSGYFRQIVRRLNVLQLLITVAVQSDEAIRFLLVEDRALLSPDDVHGILITDNLSLGSTFPSRDARALVCAILNAVDAILDPQPDQPYIDARHVPGKRPGLDECIEGLGDLECGGYRVCSLREQEPTSIAAKMFDSKLYHVAQMCASAQRKLEIAEQEERPADVGVQIERMASCSEPDGHPPVAFENTYSLSMQSPFYGGSVQTPFSGRAPAQIFNTALLGYETSHGEPPASQQNQVSSSEDLSRQGTDQLDSDSVPGSQWTTARSNLDRIV